LKYGFKVKVGFIGKTFRNQALFIDILSIWYDFFPGILSTASGKCAK